MKTLFLIRHAKSSWKFDVTDHERPLKKRGYNDAKIVANNLNKYLKISPDLVLISNAKRAIQTAEIFIEELGWENLNCQLNNDLYDFSGEDAFRVITSCPDEVSTLVVFGHNPTLSILASQLGSNFIENLPTSGVVIINFDVNSWDDIKNGLTIKTIYPRDLKE